MSYPPSESMKADILDRCSGSKMSSAEQMTTKSPTAEEIQHEIASHDAQTDHADFILLLWLLIALCG